MQVKASWGRKGLGMLRALEEGGSKLSDGAQRKSASGGGSRVSPCPPTPRPHRDLCHVSAFGLYLKCKGFNQRSGIITSAFQEGFPWCSWRWGWRRVWLGAGSGGYQSDVDLRCQWLCQGVCNEDEGGWRCLRPILEVDASGLGDEWEWEPQRGYFRSVRVCARDFPRTVAL